MKPGAFKGIAREIGALVEKKNAAYGSSFKHAPEILRVLYPKGISTAQYEDALLVVRIIDKLQRIATDRDAMGESPYRDIAGYGILGAALHEFIKQEAAGDAAQVPAVGMQQRRKEERQQVLQREVPTPAGGEGAARETEYLRIEEVPAMPAQPHWSPRWKAERSDQGMAQESVSPAKEELTAKRGRWIETTPTPTSKTGGILQYWPLKNARDCYAYIDARQQETTEHGGQR